MPPSKAEPAYWREKLFKNTFTYKGRQIEVKGWSIKIQLAGRRKTFSLKSGDRARAAREACEIYQTILAHGWEAAASGGLGSDTRPDDSSAETLSPALNVADAEYWKRRLIHRKYLEPPNARADREFSVRIEHTSNSNYFPLGTDDETEAAERAMRIYQTVVHHGWATANANFPRELTLALRWLDNPVAWTYATFHTQKSNGRNLPVISKPGKRSGLNVAIIEPDDGIRFALADCVDSQDGFRCKVAFASVLEALREMPRHRLHLVLANHILADRSGIECLEAVRRVTPEIAGLLYSIYEDSDELFAASPGGATGYLLKRTSPFRIIEPLGNSVGPLTREYIAARVREYFQNLLTALPAGPSSLELAKLTPREHEILTLLSKGGVAKEIAHTLGISLWTVHGHVKNIFEKLHVHTRTEAVVKFLQK